MVRAPHAAGSGPRTHWHDLEEDRDLAAGFEAEAHSIIRRSVACAWLLPRGFVLIGLLGLVPTAWAGSASAGGLAIGLGGVLLASRAFARLGQGLRALAAGARGLAGRSVRCW